VERIPATPDEIAKFIERSVADIPDAEAKRRASERMRDGLVVDPVKDDTTAIAKSWSDCEQAGPAEDLDQKLTDFLLKLVCEDSRNGRWVAHGIIHNGILETSSALLAGALLSSECAPAKDLDETDKERLRTYARILAAPVKEQ
jgi:hypothetical protein